MFGRNSVDQGDNNKTDNPKPQHSEDSDDSDEYGMQETFFVDVYNDPGGANGTDEKQKLKVC